MSGGDGSDSGPSSISAAGIGFPNATRLRTNQTPPIERMAASHTPAIRSRRSRGAITTAPTARAASGTVMESFVPIAAAAASAASVPGAPEAPPFAMSAAAATSRARPTTSL